MHQSSLSLSSFGTAEERVRAALASLSKGGGVCVVDDENRENEGDLIFSAQHLTVPQMAMLIRHCSGIVCLCLTDEHVQRLELPMMTDHNTNTQGTAFTVTIEAATGVTTGVSAATSTTGSMVSTAATLAIPRSVPVVALAIRLTTSAVPVASVSLTSILIPIVLTLSLCRRCALRV